MVTNAPRLFGNLRLWPYGWTSRLLLLDVDAATVLLPAYDASTEYVLSTFGSFVAVSEHFPTPSLSAAVQSVVLPVMTFTKPVGVSEPSAVTVTVKLSLCSLPHTTDAEESERVMALGSFATVSAAAADIDAQKCEVAA